jgi:hypothetical protein
MFKATIEKKDGILKIIITKNYCYVQHKYTLFSYNEILI